MEKAKGKSICIFSAKGGVGKTITAINLAGVFSCLKQKVLIIDLDITSGAVASYLNKNIKKTIYNFADDYLNIRFNKIEDYATKYNELIHFIAACQDPRQGSKLDSTIMCSLIEKAVFEYDTVIVDMNHKIDKFNIDIIDSCDETLLVMNNDLMNIKNMYNLITIFKEAVKTNYKVLLNNCVFPNKNYYTIYDIKNIMGTNIDYKIDSNFHIKTIDSYIADGQILTLDKKMTKVFPKVYKTYMTICSDLMEDNNEE